jgi:DNA-binding NtrC family response regulator
MMPGMNGFQVLEQIKEQAPSTEVIVITGLNETGLGIECLEKGAFEFMAKPLNLDHLEFLLKFKLGQMGVTS